jgi:hypothetical protein
MVTADALGAALERLARVETSCGVSLSPVFSTVSMTASGPIAVVTCTVPPSGRLRTMAFCRRFVVSFSRTACEPTMRATSPEVSMVTPCLSAKGRSVSVASSAMRTSRAVLECRSPDRPG